MRTLCAPRHGHEINQFAGGNHAVVILIGRSTEPLQQRPGECTVAAAKLRTFERQLRRSRLCSGHHGAHVRDASGVGAAHPPIFAVHTLCTKITSSGLGAGRLTGRRPLWPIIAAAW